MYRPPNLTVAAVSDRHADWQYLLQMFCGARPPDLSLRGGRRGNLGQAVAFSPRPSCDPAGYCEIATAPSGPRNDKLGSLMPMNLRCMICKRTRRSLRAATDAIGIYHFNGSQYELGVHRRERHAAPLQGVCGRQSAAAFPSAIRYDYAKRTAGRPSSALFVFVHCQYSAGSSGVLPL